MASFMKAAGSAVQRAGAAARLHAPSFAGYETRAVVEGNGKMHNIEICTETAKLLRIAMLAGTNILIEKSMESDSGIWALERILTYLPEFSKIAVVQAWNPESRNAFHEGIIRERLSRNRDVAYIRPEMAHAYGADITICPFYCSSLHGIMNFSRSGRHYIAVCNGMNELLGRFGKRLEGLNSVDMIITPFESGFEIKEVRWLSRAETESGKVLHGSDMIDVRKVGDNLALRCNPSSAKCVRRYAEIRGEGAESLWNSLCA